MMLIVIPVTLIQYLYTLATIEDAVTLSSFLPALEVHQDIFTILEIKGIKIFSNSEVLGLLVVDHEL